MDRCRFCLAVVLGTVLVFVLILIAVLVLILILVLVIHDRSSKWCDCGVRFHSLPQNSGFIPCFEKETGKKSENHCSGNTPGAGTQTTG